MPYWHLYNTCYITLTLLGYDLTVMGRRVVESQVRRLPSQWQQLLKEGSWDIDSRVCGDQGRYSELKHYIFQNLTKWLLCQCWHNKNRKLKRKTCKGATNLWFEETYTADIHSGLFQPVYCRFYCVGVAAVQEQVVFSGSGWKSKCPWRGY